MKDNIFQTEVLLYDPGRQGTNPASEPPGRVKLPACSERMTVSMKAVTAKPEPGGRKRVFVSLGAGLVGGVVVSLLALLLIAAVYTVKDLPQSSALPLSCAAYGLGALFGGFLAAKKTGARGLISGALTGLVFFAALFLIGAVMRVVGNGGLAFLKLLLSVVCGSLGGVFGVNSGKRARRS